MKKKIFSILLILCLLGSLSVCAYAEHYYGSSNWYVTFTSAGKIVDNLDQKEWNDDLAGLQPGDDLTMTITLTNKNGSNTNWYMKNEVLKSLEDKSANSATAGGGYSYLLTYTDPNGVVDELYNSDTVGGEHKAGEREGLREATSNLEDYFYLDTMAPNQSAKITLKVALDGETQGNDYQDTLANLMMKFAVELTNTTTTRANPVKTGDDTDLNPYYIAMFLSGLVLLYFVLDGITDRVYGKKGRR